jgi:hypothetical protein
MNIFLVCILVALLPSVLAVLWLIWRSSSWPGSHGRPKSTSCSTGLYHHSATVDADRRRDDTAVRDLGHKASRPRATDGKVGSPTTSPGQTSSSMTNLAYLPFA